MHYPSGYAVLPLLGAGLITIIACGSGRLDAVEGKMESQSEVKVDWQKEFESRYHNPRSSLYDRTKGHSTGWSYTYPMYSYLSMCRATNDTKWLDHMAVRIDNLIDQMRDVPDWGAECWSGYGDGFVGWGTVGFTEQYDEFMVHDGHTCIPIARFVKLVYRNPALLGKYGPKADQYLSVLEGHIIAKWHANWNAKRGTRTYLREWGGWQNLPHNMYLSFGTLLLVLHEISQLPQYAPVNPAFPEFYLQQATAMARYFGDDLRFLEKEDAYLWDYMVGDRREDTGHANLDIEFAIRAYHLGVVFSNEDMRRFANTFVGVLWNRDEVSPDFRTHIDLMGGYGDDSIVTGRWHYHLMRWLWLYEFDPRVGRLINQHYVSLPKKQMNEVFANLACWRAGVFEDDHPGFQK